MKLSIVTTLYGSERYIADFHERITKEARKITCDYEVIYVDDGSPDRSLDLAISLSTQDCKVKVIELSRNHGHHKAIMTGLAHARGERIFLIDVDLEEPPELLADFHKELELNAREFDVVYGVQEKRKGGWFEQISGELFYKVFNFFTGFETVKNQVTARIMTKSYVTELIRHQERELFLGGIFFITGFKQKSLIVTKHSTSETTYSLAKKMALFESAVTSFSNKPLKIIFHTGIITSLLSFIYIVYISLKKLFLGIPIDGWTSIIASIWFLGGIIILFIGVIGIYLSKIFTESKARPYYIVKKIHVNNQAEV